MKDDIDLHIPKSVFWKFALMVIAGGFTFAGTVAAFGIDMDKDVEKLKHDVQTNKDNIADQKDSLTKLQAGVDAITTKLLVKDEAERLYREKTEQERRENN